MARIHHASLKELDRVVDEGLRALEEKQHPHVTDAGKECDRQVVYSLMNYPSDALTTDSLINFAVGSAVEEAFAGMVGMVGGKIERELRVEIPAGDITVSGRVDMLILLEPAIMVELKSTSSRSMGWMLKRGANRGHIHQVNLYMHASQEGLLLGRDGDALVPFDTSYVVYVVKDAVIREPPIHAFKVPYDREMATGDLARLAALQLAADRKVIPPIPEGYDWKKYPCAWCGHRSLCWSGSQTQPKGE